MTKDEKNRKIAEWLGWTQGSDGLWIPPHDDHYNEPLPDFFTDESASALVLEKLLQIEGLALHMMIRDGRLQFTVFRDDMGTEYKTDRKTAIAEAALKLIDTPHASGQTM